MAKLPTKVKAEPVRETIKRSMKEAGGEEPETQVDPDADDDDDEPIGLVENPEGVPFQCATCDYFDDGICENPRAKLHGKEVKGKQCCNWYEHPGMQVIVK